MILFIVIVVVTLIVGALIGYFFARNSNPYSNKKVEDPKDETIAVN